MGGSSNSMFGKMLNNVYPRMHDYNALIADQTKVVVDAAGFLVEFMEKNDKDKGEIVCGLEHQADQIKARNLDILGKSIVTPMDREDIYRAMVTIDMVLNYMKSTVREMQTLGIGSDQFTTEMAVLIREGCNSLKAGYDKLSGHAAEAEDDVMAVFKCERNLEKAYRRAIAALFNADLDIKALEANTADAEIKAMEHIMDMFRRREVYRHMSNAGDELARAGAILHDIVVQVA